MANMAEPPCCMRVRGRHAISKGAREPRTWARALTWVILGQQPQHHSRNSQQLTATRGGGSPTIIMRRCYGAHIKQQQSWRANRLPWNVAGVFQMQPKTNGIHFPFMTPEMTDNSRKCSNNKQTKESTPQKMAKQDSCTPEVSDSDEGEADKESAGKDCRRQGCT